MSGPDPGCAKTPALNLLVESSSQFEQSENQKCWRGLSEEGNRENGSTLSWLAHVFTWPGPKAAVRFHRHQCWPVPRCLATAPSTMHYLDRPHRPSFGAIGWVRIRSPKCAKHRQHSLGIDKAAESTMLRELSGAPDLCELIEPDSVFSAIG